ncbi:MotE family protein [Profundibacterium mesophilum]|uniref:Magnesium transporter MgtE intracellular domain-containing protein n=1 Tax=Profundibacterium mesophilum KAUST100406-0324 TaxID=1037889 RepID=A0A921TC33_9RHOB|nr:hypothetical protein [Profundibacterium mesophilum]KAF0674626.1 hypothetical protein PMES_03008 [Profundibacterium mesophilum KAUST100406-0324]
MRRPATLIFAGLALAGLAKGGLSIAESGYLGADVASRSEALSYAAQAAPEAPRTPPAPAALPVAAPAETACEMPEEMLAALTRERELVTEQQAELEQRGSEIELASEQLAAETARLGELKSDLEALLAKVAAAQTSDVDRLVALYRNMKPKEAALIMDDLDIEVSVMVLGTMAERDAAPILAKLSPVRARAISQIILERSKLPGDQRLEGIQLN